MKKVKRKLSKPGMYILLGLLAIVLITVSVINKWTFHYKGIEESNLHIEYGQDTDVPEISSYFTGTLFPVIHINTNLEKEGTVDTSTLGEYPVQLHTKFLFFKDDTTVTYIVEDTTPPTIELVTNLDSYTLYNHPYVEEGFKAIDLKDGDISDKVQSEEKDGVVYYTVTDSSGNVGKAERKIHYDDKNGPVITINNDADTVVYVGETFYDSFTAIDDSDGDVTKNVSVEGSVDSNTPGEYTLKYIVKDAHENETTYERTVTVKEKPVNIDNGVHDGHTIFLTFDDGPGPYTDQLLDILAKYNVKATFFTTSRNSEYLYCIAKEQAAGHTVAVHTYSHDYRDIYSSPEAYWRDFDAQNQNILSQTGHTTNLFRFPGGSSNTVSAEYCKGIMSTLVNQSLEKGYVYFDWNISSGDAGETTSTKDVIDNVINGIKNQSKYGYSSIVLQHDIKQFSVEAVESIIKWGLEHGYSFQALNVDSPKAHHSVNN